MRPTKVRTIGWNPQCHRFFPQHDVGVEQKNDEVTIRLDMLEAMRLVDALGMSQEEAARSMNISTPTLCRILGQGRRLAAQALTGGNPINIEGGNVMHGNGMQGMHGNHGGSDHGRRQGGACSHGHGKGRGRCAAGHTGQGHCKEHASDGAEAVVTAEQEQAKE
ncbi:MAG: DUF134 domain-containing protein [Desulfovibrionaceae bacterium]|nr:DUF134 domain-containing protein [Desulfovibrionaceae bacterium]